MTEKQWTPTRIAGKRMQEFAEWLNSWADVDKAVPNEKANAYERGYEAGYHKAVRDICDRIGFDYVEKDKTEPKTQREKALRWFERETPDTDNKIVDLWHQSELNVGYDQFRAAYHLYVD